jgi:hypothetical protein
VQYCIVPAYAPPHPCKNVPIERELMHFAQASVPNPVAYSNLAQGKQDGKFVVFANVPGWQAVAEAPGNPQCPTLATH